MNCVTSGIIRIFLCVALCASIIQAFGLGIVHQRSSQLFKTQNGLQTRFKLHPSIISSQYRRSTFQPHMAVDSVTLESLSNYEEDGTWLAKAVQVALDEEWLPQKVHEEIGDRVKNIYIELRATGVNATDAVVQRIASFIAESYSKQLKELDYEFASELLKGLIMQMVSQKETTPTQVEKGAGSFVLLDQEYCKKLADEYDNQFSRYRFLQDVMDGEIGWDEISAVTALVLGYRPGEDGNIDNTNVPEEWKANYPKPPALGDDKALFERLEETFPDHPDELELMDEMIGKLYGEGSYKIAIASENKNILNRAVLVKWLFHTNDFLDEFPEI